MSSVSNDRHVSNASHLYTRAESEEQRRLLNVAKELGCYGIQTYLRENPELQGYAVLITDHVIPPMFFGSLTNVKRRVLRTKQMRDPEELTSAFVEISSAHRSLKNNNIPSYDKKEDRQIIKLIELSGFDSLYDVARMEQGLDRLSDFQDIDLDEASFMFLPTCSTGINTGHRLRWCVELEYRLDQFTDCKWHVGSRTFLTDVPEVDGGDPAYIAYHPSYKGPKFKSILPGSIIWGFEKLQSWGPRVSNLLTLRVEGIQHFPENLWLPHAVQVAIVFERPMEGGSPPEINGLIAPELRTLLVHFDTVMPTIKCCKLGTKGPQIVTTVDGRALNADDFSRSFEIADINYTTRGLRSKDIHSPTNQSFEPFDLKFLEICDDLIVGGGVPLGAFDQSSLQNIEHFYWQICREEDALVTDGKIKMESLCFIHISIQTESVNLPEFQGLCVSCSLFVSSFAEDVSIKRFWRGPWRSFRECYLYSSPRLLHRGVDLDRILSVTKEDWEFTTQTMDCGYMISLVGFKMDFLSKDVASQEGGLCKYQHWDVIAISPVMEPENDTLTVGTFELNFLTRYLTIRPLFLERAPVPPEITLHLNTPVSTQWSEPSKSVVATTTRVTKVVLSGRELSMVPDERWKKQLLETSKHRYHPRTKILSHRWEIPTHLDYDSCLNEPPTDRIRETIFYNPCVRFPDDLRTYTVHRKYYETYGEPPRV